MQKIQERKRLDDMAEELCVNLVNNMLKTNTPLANEVERLPEDKRTEFYTSAVENFEFHFEEVKERLLVKAIEDALHDCEE